MPERQAMIDRPDRHILGDEALAYARKRVWLARELESGLTDVLAAEGWRAYTLADPDVSNDRLVRLAEGGLAYAQDAQREMAREVTEAMRRHPSPVWIVPDSLGRPTDRVVLNAGVDFLVRGESVYYVARSDDPDGLLAVWWQAASAAGQLGFVSAAGAAADDVDYDLDAALLQAVLVVFTVFDGESFLFLERDGPGPTPGDEAAGTSRQLLGDGPPMP